MNGILIINKPKGYSSHDVVNVIRKTLGIKKVGHTGTLDPGATGVLPILIGQATKTSKYLIEHDKTYIATLKLGKKTATGDEEGEVIEEKEFNEELKTDVIEQVLKSFIGEQEQVPPIYSAIKINGKKAYEYARENKEVKIEPRKILIYELKLISNNFDEIVFEVSCSKGTYIRTLCEDIAKKLGNIGYMKELKRIVVDKFSIDAASELDEITEEKIISIEKVFEDYDEIRIVNDNQFNKFLNGVKIKIDKPDGLYRIYNKEKFIGLGLVNDNNLKRDIVMEE